MAEQTFRSPGFFENEIDLATRRVPNLGTPAAVIGTAEHGPAFVPVTVGSFADFETKFGSLDPERFGPYAVREFLKHRTAVTYMRVLGAGANTTSAHVAATTNSGVVHNAGFKVVPNSTAADSQGRQPGSVQFLCATHTIPVATDIGFPSAYTDNDSFPTVREKNTFASITITVKDAVAINSGDISTKYLRLTMYGDAAAEQYDLRVSHGNTFANSSDTWTDDGDNTYSAFLYTYGGGARPTDAQVATQLATLFSSISGYTATASTGGTGVDSTVTITADTAVAVTYDIVSVDESDLCADFEIGVPTKGSSTTILADTVSLVRGMLFTTTGSLVTVMNTAEFAPANPDSIGDDLATPTGEGKRFKIGLYSFTDSAGNTGNQLYGDDDGRNGWRVYTASLDPNDQYYISKVLNTDPNAFQREGHLLYADYAVEEELASVVADSASIALVSGSAGAPASGLGSNNTFHHVYGRFDTRYRTPRTTSFISQPYGTTEYPLFHFETISDGAWGNDKIKVSIADLKASTDPKYPYGTFEVQIRKFDDEDFGPQMLERYPGCSIDPTHERYIAKVIGDMKVKYDFDTIDEDERRLVISGKYPNKSAWVRVRMNDLVVNREVPGDALPFGFRGIPALKTTPHNKDGSLTTGALASQGTIRLTCQDGTGHTTNLTGSIVPPLPFRFKVTKGAVSTNTTPGFIGDPGDKERADSKFYWGIKFDRIKSGSANVYNANVGGGMNPLIKTYTKLQGIQECDIMTEADTAAADAFHNHKFTLARLALRQQLHAVDRRPWLQRR